MPPPTVPRKFAPPAPAPAKGISRRAWVVLLLLGLAGFLFRFDRQVFSILKTTITGELGLSNTDYGFLVAGFMLTYTLGYFFSGRIVDRWGTEATLWLFLLGMSLATITTGFVTGFGGLLAARIVLGACAAGVMPAVLVAVTRWFPAERRATAFTLQGAMHNCGAILAPPLVAGISLQAGWPVAFVLPGVIGLGVALALRVADSNPPHAEPAGAAGPPKAGWTGITASPLLRRLLIARMCSDPLWFFLFYWQSAFLQERLGLSLAEVGRLTWIPPAFSVAATLGLGALNDAMVRAGRPALRARLKLLGAVTLLAPATLLLPWIHGSLPAVCALTLIYGMCNAWLLLTNLLVADIVPPRAVGASFGLISAGGGITSILFNLAAGPLIDAFGHTVVLSVGALMHPVAWLVLRGLDAPAAGGADRAINPAAAPCGRDSTARPA